MQESTNLLQNSHPINCPLRFTSFLVQLSLPTSQVSLESFDLPTELRRSLTPAVPLSPLHRKEDRSN